MADEKTGLDGNHWVQQFTRLGKELLENTEKTNIITLAQFEPYMEIFAPDQKRMKTDTVYVREMQRLFEAYRINLGINFYYPTIVVDRLEEPRRELYFLDRIWSRLKADVVEGKSARDDVPSNVPKIGDLNRDILILRASATDIMAANNSDDQIDQFRRNRIESAVLKDLFVKHNLNPDSRASFVGEDPAQAETPTAPPASGSSGCDFGVDDDE